jgi:hypothetical protein
MQTMALPTVGLGELDAEFADLLPQRETLCQFGCVNVANVVGVNIALAINAASINGTANAVAVQYLASLQH